MTILCCISYITKMDLFNKSNGLLGLLLLLTCSEFVLPCSISAGWAKLDMNERLILSDIVVYGKTTQHKANVRKIGSRTLSYINAVFEVYCVLKEGEDPVPEEILIEQISPRDGCSGTRDYMQLGKEAIVTLQKTDSGNYKYHEVVPTESATFLPTRASLFSIVGICDLQRWVPPVNATVNRCPICGVSNFTDAVVEVDNSLNAKSSCFYNGTLQVGASGCEMFAFHSYDNTSMCIPAAYSTTCTRLVFNQPKATCECRDLSKVFHAGFGEVGAGMTILPNLAVLWLAMSMVFLCK